MKLLNQEEAIALDVSLMRVPGFSIDQLMELAGLAVSVAVERTYPVGRHRKLLVVVGPGNNGGDGLVAARHLVHFGYQVHVHYPKRPTRDDAGRLFLNLVTQCEDMGVTFLPSMPTSDGIIADYDLVLDALFGFSFKGEVRPPFDAVLEVLRACCGVVSDAEGGAPRLVPLASIDIPSGWDVHTGDSELGGRALAPDTLISLTAPKLCATYFAGRRHWLGGRFVPPRVALEFGLHGLPPYPGSDQVVELPVPISAVGGAPSAGDGACRL